MKAVILIKQHPTVQLGHLYEHLFLRRINEYFYERGLFKYLDYAAHGTTYEHGGIITVECSLHSGEAIQAGKGVENLRIDLGDDNRNISTALYQITAEEPEKLHITDRKKIVDELNRLDQEPWRHISDLTVIDTKTLRRKNPPIYLTNQKQARPRTLGVSLKLDKDFASAHREILPVFMFVGRMILMTIGNQMAANHGTYAGGDIIGKESAISCDFYITRQAFAQTSVEEVVKTAKQTCKYICTDKTYTRASTALSSISYTSAPLTAPNLDQLICETGIVAGDKGWHELATTKNLSNVLNHTTLEVKLGRHKVTFALPG